MDVSLPQADHLHHFSMMFWHTLVYNLTSPTRHTLTLLVFAIVHHAEVEQSETYNYTASIAVHVITQKTCTEEEKQLLNIGNEGQKSKESMFMQQIAIPHYM